MKQIVEGFFEEARAKAGTASLFGCLVCLSPPWQPQENDYMFVDCWVGHVFSADLHSE